MTDETFAALVERCFTGSLPDAERAELTALVRDQARWRELYIDQVRLHLHLDALLRTESPEETGRRLELILALDSPQRDLTLVQNVQAKLGFVPRRRRLAFRLAIAGVAAAVLLLIGGMALWSWKSESTLARLALVQGEVYVVAGPTRTLAVAGQALANGQGLETENDDSAAVVVYPDGTRLELGPGTTVTELSEQEGKRLTLAEGFLLADVAPQPADRPMRLTTRHAEVVVRGTRFRLTNLPEATRIELEQGSLQLVRHNDQQTIELTPGYYAVVAADQEAVQPQPLPPRSDAPRWTLPAALGISCFAFSPDGKRLAAGSRGQIELWDPASGQQVSSYAWNGDWVYALAYSPDGRTLALTGKKSGGVRLCQVGTGDWVTLRTGSVLYLAWSPDGQTLALSDGHKTIILWDVAARRQRLVLTGHTDNITSLAFSPIGGRLASGSRDGTVRVWDPASGEELACLTEKTDPRPSKRDRVLCVAFSPDGSTLAAAVANGTIQLWDLGTGRQRANMQRHGSMVVAVAFSPDGKLLASGSNDRTIKLWDPATGAERMTLTGQESVTSLTFAPDGKSLASLGREQFVHLWNVGDALAR
jgi:ferric-dicitrate binding protein FerR (iron transport regulator)